MKILKPVIKNNNPRKGIKTSEIKGRAKEEILNISTKIDKYNSIISEIEKKRMDKKRERVACC